MTGTTTPRNFYSAPADNALREVKGAVAKARAHGASWRQVIDFVIGGYRGLSLGGPDEQHLAAIVALLCEDADDQLRERREVQRAAREKAREA